MVQATLEGRERIVVIAWEVVACSRTIRRLGKAEESLRRWVRKWISAFRIEMF